MGKSHSTCLADSHSNITLLDTNISPNFKLAVQFSEVPINMINFHLNAMQVIRDESAYPFEGSADRYVRHMDPPLFQISASSSIFPHLQHCHIVWTVQRLVEISYFGKIYTESYTKIQYRGRRDFDIVGHMTVQARAASTTASITNDSEAETPDAADTDISLPAFNGSVKRRLTTSPDQASTNAYTPLSSLQHLNANTSTLLPPYRLPFPSNEGMLIDLIYPPSSRPLQALPVFLATTRTSARLAESDPHDILPPWGFADRDALIEITVARKPGTRPTARYGDLTEALNFIVRTMLGREGGGRRGQRPRFAEVWAWLYREVPTQSGRGTEREEYALIEVKMLAAESGGDEGSGRETLGEVAR